MNEFIVLVDLEFPLSTSSLISSMLGSMAQPILNPTAEDQVLLSFAKSSFSYPLKMGDGGYGRVYKSSFTGRSNLCSKNPDFSPSLNQVKKEINKLEIFYLLGVIKETINASKETVFSRLLFPRHKNKEITIRVASFAISTIMALHISVLLCHLPLFRKHLAAFMFLAQEPLKKYGFGSILIPMLELLSYMVLVSAVASILLLRAKFTCMHSVMLFSWSILMIAELYNPISALYLTIVGIFFIGWYAVCSWKSSNQMQGQKLSGLVEPEISHDLHPSQLCTISVTK
ncbi:hypothetical protein HN51_067541 [Arachis hypogaea]|uniref:Uncharacterized protein n=1 Tax=Arachis hypogaea TaxID=3818 RepID=A0A444ZQT1_ARAHY|nr:uncharacterized protein LOC107635217 [Arachis ipaensis]XP_029148175.1 uncharacterized protein LOC112744343 [Arachis hypogaea]RYR16508.1 hypothetical protein Ahy_B04g073545 [Arachis hypogaea]